MEKVKSVKKNTVKISKNLIEFVEAAALAVVAGYAIHASLNVYLLQGVFSYILLFAGSLIAIRASLLLIHHFNK